MCRRFSVFKGIVFIARGSFKSARVTFLEECCQACQRSMIDAWPSLGCSLNNQLVKLRYVRDDAFPGSEVKRNQLRPQQRDGTPESVVSGITELEFVDTPEA